MFLNPADRRRFIEEEVYDEFVSIDTSNETDCKKCIEIETHDVISTRKSRKLLTIGVHYLFLIPSILIISVI